MAKLSKFNIEKAVPGGLIIYNSFTSGVLFLNRDYSASYHEIKESGQCTREDLKQELLKGGMLVDTTVDETNKVKILNNATRFNTSGLSLTIAPTMECNFACPYCFEEGVRYNRMTPIIERKTVEFIKENYQKGKPLGICWYGGEPLMGVKSIENITNYLFEIPELKENYSADIITNGFYLDRKTALKLMSLKVRTAQITIDGPPDIHDTRRVPQNGRPSFWKIINNIKDTHDLLDIVIRVNVDRSNMSRVNEILSILEKEGLKNKVGFYIAAVDDSAAASPNPACFSDKEFSEEEFQFYIDALNRGFNVISIPGQNLGICGAISLSSFVIDPLGELYKCWNEIGRREKKVGSVFKGPVFNTTMNEYLNYEAVSDEKCHDCPVLPACMGGCPYINMNANRRCNSILYNADKLIELVYSKQKVGN